MAGEILVYLDSVAGFDPMNRGLKDLVRSLELWLGTVVAGFDPMNRGLKVSYRVFQNSRHFVAGFDPMNRGLKEQHIATGL